MNRSVLVLDTRLNTKFEMESTAETFGALKEELRAHGVDVEGMAVQEGLTRTELLSDDTILPKQIPYMGTVTDNLVLRITQKDKHIKSGSMDREDLLDALMGHENEVYAELHACPEDCSTVALQDYYEKHIRPRETAAGEARNNVEKAAEEFKRGTDNFLGALVEAGILGGSCLTRGTMDNSGLGYTHRQVEEMFKGL